MTIDEYTDFELAEFFAFLDDIKADGSTNMKGAAPDLERAFDMPLTDARDVLASWFGTLDPWRTPMERARDAINLMRAD